MIIDGKLVSSSIKENLKNEIIELKEKTGVSPKLTVVLVGEDPASQIYVSNKHKTCLKLGIESEVVKLPENTSQEDLEAKIEELKNDNSV
ncbi:MAG: bifunctional 5,10-methylene-tetrahydrofolate dehydrogenase/5,10-methylene-tetrahydrofolate cyclohydrolase, partial [Gammaproteobacteria bacterium]|nr:bifunctional 5,10-methylene-tetrahydrofolate dehydrogenase/5,10-methylene-tetrahydrofolate cyclohydrolase [Gammaproteobacteria bacterium]